MLRFTESEEQYIYVSFSILFSMHIYIEELLDRLEVYNSSIRVVCKARLHSPLNEDTNTQAYGR